jgi:murein DD-endopeptidase MepM/ murein hydrolase activator NlpD
MEDDDAVYYVIAGVIAAAGAGAYYVMTRKPAIPAIALSGVPLAKPTGKVWPVLARPGLVPYKAENGVVFNDSREGVSASRVFGSSREGGKRLHAGVDIAVNPGDGIVAMEKGKVIGRASGYVGLDAVVIEHPTVTVIYGEIAPGALETFGLTPGKTVEAGARIGTAARSSQGSMLHIETWQNGMAPTGFTEWRPGSPQPGLLDPTAYLLTLAAK